MTDTKHSQLPWKISEQDLEWDEKDDDDEVWVSSAHNHTLFLCEKEDARFIVTACNSHYELVEALRSIVKPYSEWDDDRIYDDLGSAFGGAVISARNALAKVKP